MKASEQKAAAKEFAEKWRGKGYEKGHSQTFWLELLSRVYGADSPDYIKFEERVLLDRTGFIDGYIEKTKVLIEQKSVEKDLKKPVKQSDGSFLTPFQQAKRYVLGLPLSKHPRWIVVCNFAEFHVYDMEKPHGEPEIIKLENLPKEYYRLNFLVDGKEEKIQKETEVSLKAGDIIGKIYNCLLKQYKNPESETTEKSLNKLCVRLVFCLYAEDAGVFGRHGMFCNYLKQFEAKHLRTALIELFKVLNTKAEERNPYLDEELAEFPYVNGGLFAGDNEEIPQLTEEIKNLLLQNAGDDFDWSVISPAVFGAVFESTLNPETRRKGGMHYTSTENIHKVIDPLFLDGLGEELENISGIGVWKTKEKRLKEYIQKLSELTFLDPACGSGNFLTETYISLRRLENRALAILTKGQIVLDFANPIKVSIKQFYGIEINDFAVTVAQTALWIAESQMMKETESIVHMNLDFLPLKTYANIVEGNALRMDWESIVPKEKLNYIMGNPPFVGYSNQNKEQKADMLAVYADEKGKPYKKAGKTDYVAAWYFKAAELMKGTEISTAFVSTNSITQGEQVAAVWQPLYERFGTEIDFAHRTFVWESEANGKAHVHCVIVGFSFDNKKTKRKKLYYNGRVKIVENINAYLQEAPNVLIESRNKPICGVPILQNGGKPTEGGYLILSEKEKNNLIISEPLCKSFIRPYMMGKDFINRKPRYCLWLVNANPTIISKCPSVLKRIEEVRKYRLKSTKSATRKKAETPMLFDEVRECDNDYVAIPKVSSGNRRYIPMEYLSSQIIPGDKLFMALNSTEYHFGILTSNVHMAWMRAVGGRLKSDYSYSNTLVYNNFPWCSSTAEQKAEIEQTARGILNARALYPESSLADLYNELTMPVELRKAHQQNDIAVMKAYGFYKKDTNNKKRWLTESECVAELMKMYRKLTEK